MSSLSDTCGDWPLAWGEDKQFRAGAVLKYIRLVVGCGVDGSEEKGEEGEEDGGFEHSEPNLRQMKTTILFIM